MASILDLMNSFGINDLNEVELNNEAEEFLSQIDVSTIKGTAMEDYLIENIMKTRGEFKLSEDGKMLINYKGKDLYVSIPEGITEIGEYAFCESMKMIGVDIPQGVTSIGKSAFRLCHNLRSIELPDSVQIIDYEAFNGCRKITTIDLPNSLKIIKDGAFNFCESLEKIYIPSSVELFENNFYYTPSLQEIHVEWHNLDNISVNAFDNINSRARGLRCPGVDFKQCILYVPHGMMHAYRHHPAFRFFLTIIPE